MSLGRNLQYLRKQKKLTQEQFAERMGVSRQTVSRWEADEVVPELSKLVDICSVFSCKLDAIVREDLEIRNQIYSEVSIRRVEGFRMARYVMISPNPEDDVNRHMEWWAANSGLKAVCPQAKRIGWDFPFVSPEQQNRFGMHGYAAAYIIPDGFESSCPGVEYAVNRTADYAVITITEPFVQPFERIPNAYQKIMDYLGANNFREKPQEDVLSCFELVYKKEDITYMDVYMHVDGVTKTNAWSMFNS